MSNGVINRAIAIEEIEQDMTSERPSYYAIIPADVRYDKELTPNAKLLYGEITALCGKDGRCWAENRYFADLYGVSKTSISKWIKALSDKGYISCELVYKKGTKEIERRYIRIVSYPIEEKLSTPIEEKLKENNTRENNIKRIYISEFLELWTLYPNKKGKEKALSAYIKARESGTEKETVEKGIKDYAKECELKGREKDYIKYGSTWFNQHGWEDEYDLTPARKTKQAYSRKDDTDLTGIL